MTYGTDDWVRLEPAELAPARRKAVAALCLEALPDFYAALPIGRERLLDVVSRSLGTPRSELADPCTVVRDGVDVALLTTTPGTTLAAAQLRDGVELRRCDPTSGDLKAALAQHASRVEPVQVTGLYCSRLIVSRNVRRQGLGRSAVRHLIDMAAGACVSLHVAATNAPAIVLYRQFGFSFLSDEPYAFRAMQRQGAELGTHLEVQGWSA